MGKLDDVNLTNKEFKDKPKKSTKTKKENTMKKSIIVAVVSVIATLAIVGAFVSVFYAGVNYEAKKQHQISSKIEAAVETSKK